MKTRTDAAAAKQRNAFKPSATFKATKEKRRTKNKLAAAVTKFVQSGEENDLRNVRAALNGEDLPDVTPVAHQITDRILDEFARLSDRRTKGLTEWQKEFLKKRKLGNFLGLCETLANTQVVRARLQKLRQSYEKSLGIRSNTTKNGRLAIGFLEEYHQASWTAARFKPQWFAQYVLHKINENDWGFFESLAAAMKFREACTHATSIAQTRRLRKQITEAAILQGTKGLLTWREVKNLFEYNGDRKNLEKLLKQCGYEWKRQSGGRPAKRNRGTEKNVCAPFLKV
jgi:hypothetical protein